MPRPTILELASTDVGDLDAPVTCPAGQRIDYDGVPGALCGITESIISVATDPNQFIGFCAGDGSRGCPGYTECVVWRAQREAEWEAQGRKVA